MYALAKPILALYNIDFHTSIYVNHGCSSFLESWLGLGIPSSLTHHPWLVYIHLCVLGIVWGVDQIGFKLNSLYIWGILMVNGRKVLVL